jgi:protocatechuate 3,4-dioxygenase beta subunit
MELPPVSRRQAIAGLGTISLSALLAACSEDDTQQAARSQTTTEAQSTPSDDLSGLFDDTSSCTLTPELTEGPFYFDVDSIRSDIREDREGVALRLAIRVRDAERCEPIRNAVVDIWQSDAEGQYSAEGETFLRGAQVTNAQGIADFLTIYPGWYQGRTVHIHAKVHLDKQTVLTTQLFFDEKTQREVYDGGAYPAGDTDNASDGISTSPSCSPPGRVPAGTWARSRSTWVAPEPASTPGPKRLTDLSTAVQGQRRCPCPSLASELPATHGGLRRSLRE